MLAWLAPVLALPEGPTWAQVSGNDASGRAFLGTQVAPLEGTYLVLKDANVRARPATKGRRIGRREKGERVRVVGRAKGPWLAIVDDEGKDVGFVFQPTLLPVIDGSLDASISGGIGLAKTPSCNYEIDFIGKSEAAGQVYEFADYEVAWLCRIDGKSVGFITPMFVTEGPYKGVTKRVHQITVDLLNLTNSLEEVLSTNMIWDRDAGTVAFDSITMKQFGRPPIPPERPADDLTKALPAAIALAATAWNQSLWRALTKRKDADDD